MWSTKKEKELEKETEKETEKEIEKEIEQELEIIKLKKGQKVIALLTLIVLITIITKINEPTKKEITFNSIDKEQELPIQEEVKELEEEIKEVKEADNGKTSVGKPEGYIDVTLELEEEEEESKSKEPTESKELYIKSRQEVMRVLTLYIESTTEAGLANFKRSTKLESDLELHGEEDMSTVIITYCAKEYNPEEEKKGNYKYVLIYQSITVKGTVKAGMYELSYEDGDVLKEVKEVY